MELHDNKKFALDRENYLTLNYEHSVNGVPVKGTVWPKGLNMIPGGKGIKTGALDVVISNFFDVIALTTLGLHAHTIAEILSKVYKIKITKGTLSSAIGQTEFESFAGLQEAVLKPIIWEMVKDLNIKVEDMADLLAFGYGYLDTKLNQWFGHSILKLRQIIRAGCIDWQQIKEFSSDALDIFRGRTPEEVKKVLLKSKKPSEELAVLLGLGTMSSGVMYKISQFFTKKNIFIHDLVRYLRKEECIALLKQGIDPHVILEEHFGLEVWMNKAGKTYVRKGRVRYYFENIFKDSRLTLEDIIRAYHCNPGNILARYAHGSVILKE